MRLELNPPATNICRSRTNVWREVNLMLNDTCFPLLDVKNNNALTCLMITVLLPVSHVTFSAWQHMALLCNSADKEWSNRSHYQMKCNLLCAGFSLTQPFWFASEFSLYSLECDNKQNHLAVVCWNPPLCRPAPFPSSSFPLQYAACSICGTGAALGIQSKCFPY